MKTDTPAIGVDVGSTNIKFGVVHRDGSLKEAFSAPTQARQGADLVMERIRDGIAGLIRRADAAPASLEIGRASCRERV